MLGLRFSIKF